MEPPTSQPKNIMSKMNFIKISAHIGLDCKALLLFNFKWFEKKSITSVYLHSVFVSLLIDIKKNLTFLPDTNPKPVAKSMLCSRKVHLQKAIQTRMAYQHISQHNSNLFF
jgi:hypothetical protein